MPTLELDGFAELAEAFRRAGNVPESVTDDALKAMSAVAAAKIRSTGAAMDVRDPESDIHILDTIKVLKPKTGSDGRYVDITFSGSRTRGKTKTRNAEIAFVNEYGKHGQPARPFVGTAMEKNADAIADAGGKVLGDWLDKTF